MELEQLDKGEGLVEVHHTKTYVEIPVSNPTKHNAVLASRTALGSIQLMDSIIQTDQMNSVQVNGVDTQPLNTAVLWNPPVDIAHLWEEKHAAVKQLLYEESNAFARDSDDIRCIPNLQMTITLKDDIPVQRSYAAIPKPLYKEVKEYIQDLLARKWIVKSKSAMLQWCACEKRREH